MKFSAWFGIIVGLLMLGQWGFFFAAGAVPEVRTEPVRLAFHLAAELTTAACLIASGVALLRRLPWGRTLYPVAAGLLAYTAIVSPGYFAQQGQWGFVVMFAALLALDVASLLSLRRFTAESPSYSP